MQAGEVFLNIIGVIVLMLPVLVFHLLFFGRSKKTRHLFISFIASQFIFIGIALILSLIGLFYAWLVFLLYIIIVVVLHFFLRKRKNIGSAEWQWSDLVMGVIFSVFTFLFQIIYGFVFGPDTYSRYLTWGSVIASTHALPSVIVNGLIYQPVFSPPVNYLYISFLFSLFQSVNEQLLYCLPVFFAGMLVFLLMSWAREQKIGYAKYIIVLVLISSVSFLADFKTLGTEIYLITAFTVAFYFLQQYLMKRAMSSLLFMTLALGFASLIKMNGMFLSLLFFLVLFVELLIREKHKVKRLLSIIGLFLVTHVLSIVWFVRNTVLFQNPFYRQLYQYFPGPWNEYHRIAAQMYEEGVLAGAEQFKFSVSKIVSMHLAEFPVLLIVLLVALFVLWRVVMRKKVKSHEWIALISTGCLLVFMVFGYLHLPRVIPRYQFPFFGVFALITAIVFYFVVEFMVKRFRLEKKSFFGFFLSSGRSNLNRLLFALVIIGLVLVLVFSSQIKNEQENPIYGYFSSRNIQDITYFGVSEPYTTWKLNIQGYETKANLYHEVLGLDALDFDSKDAEYILGYFDDHDIEYVLMQKQYPLYFINREMAKPVGVLEEAGVLQVELETDGFILWKIRKG